MKNDCFNLYVGSTPDDCLIQVVSGASLERCTALACNLFNSTAIDGALAIKCVKLGGTEMPTVFVMYRV